MGTQSTPILLWASTGGSMLLKRVCRMRAIYSSAP